MSQVEARARSEGIAVAVSPGRTFPGLATPSSASVSWSGGFQAAGRPPRSPPSRSIPQVWARGPRGGDRPMDERELLGLGHLRKRRPRPLGRGQGGIAPRPVLRRCGRGEGGGGKEKDGGDSARRHIPAKFIGSALQQRAFASCSLRRPLPPRDRGFASPLRHEAVVCCERTSSPGPTSPRARRENVNGVAPLGARGAECHGGRRAEHRHTPAPILQTGPVHGAGRRAHEACGCSQLRATAPLPIGLAKRRFFPVLGTPAERRRSGWTEPPRGQKSPPAPLSHIPPPRLERCDPDALRSAMRRGMRRKGSDVSIGGGTM